MKRGALIGLGFMLAACDTPPAKAPIGIAINLPVTRFVLTNGLEVIVQEDHRVPRVAVNLRYHVGYKDDPLGRSGMAHLVEHLQFTGSQHTAPDAFFHTVNDLGAEDVNGTTDNDATAYFETVPSSALDAMLWIEADRMASAKLGWPDAMIAREKNVVAQELRLRYRNEPNGYRYQLLSRAVYPEGHPYRHQLDEEAEERASTADELRDLATRYYSPDNATLMLVGDVTTEQAKALVTKHFSAIAPCIGCRAVRMVPPVERAALKRLRVAADIDSPLAFVAWPLPSAGQGGSDEVPFALRQLTGGVMAYAETSENHKNTMRPGSIHWYVADRSIGGGRLGSLGFIEGVPVSGATADDLLEAIEVARRRMVAYEWGHTSAQATDTIMREIRGVESLAQRAKSMQDYLELFERPDAVMDRLEAVSDVTRSRLDAAADRFFDLDRAVVVSVTPDASAPRGGKIVEEIRR